VVTTLPESDAPLRPRFGLHVLHDFREALRTQGPFWRSLAQFGALHTPLSFVRYSPPLWALPFAFGLRQVRARVRANLRLVRGPATALQEELDIYATFSHFASCLTEGFARNRREPPPFRYTIEGREHFEYALGAGTGVLLATAHTGIWEAAGPLLRRAFDLELVVAMQEEVDSRSRRIHDEARRRTGIRIIHIGTDPLSVLPLLSHLRRRGAVGLQIDRTPSGVRGIGVSLFGRRGSVPAGPFLLARATGTPVVPIFGHRRGFLDYSIQICEPLFVSRQATTKQLAVAAQSAASAMEAFLREHPTHWFHFV
jgi:phosphatidylinositol dimannoside acyltransferase